MGPIPAEIAFKDTGVMLTHFLHNMKKVMKRGDLHGGKPASNEGRNVFCSGKKFPSDASPRRQNDLTKPIARLKADQMEPT